MSLRSTDVWRRAWGLAVLLALTLLACAGPARAAGTTGTITGTVRNPAGLPLAGAKVSAAAPSGSASAVTDARGFYALQQLTPDTYTVSVEKSGYQPMVLTGVTVNQDQQAVQDALLSPQLTKIGSVSARSPSDLNRPFTGTDVYNVTAAQQNAATGGDQLNHNLYQFIATVPGVSSNGYPGAPTIRGGQGTDLGWEYDGVPATDRIFGGFTTNITDTGIGNIEVYTGGLSSENAANGTGVINSVVKTGRAPGTGFVSYGLTDWVYNNYMRAEYGNATRNNKLSYFVAFNGVNSHNDYSGDGNGNYPLLYVNNIAGTGPVTTREVVGNVHWRPSARNDFQFLYQNDFFDFYSEYGIATPKNPLLSLRPCPGAAKGAGGTAPNGAACPGGLYFGGIEPSQAGFLGHYSGIGKVQWNHTIGERSSLQLRLAENFNQYIFHDQITDSNIPQYENDPAYGGLYGGYYQTQTVGPTGKIGVDTCPPYPYAVGTPLVILADGTQCTADTGDYYQDRKSHMYFLSGDYTNTVNANLTLRLGAGQEYDDNYYAVYYLNRFNSDGTWPRRNSLSNVPSHVPFAYAQATINSGKFTFEPGLRWQRMWYGFPGGSISTGVFDPTFAGTFRASRNDTIRYSYGLSSSFIGTGYLYRLDQFGKPQGTYDPHRPNASFAPQTNKNADLMLEHAFANGTSLRVGPYYRTTNNYFTTYHPVTGYVGGVPITDPKVTATANNQRDRDFGLEFALNRTDPRPVGISYFLSGTYDNYWTTSQSNSFFANTPIALDLLQKNFYIRDSRVPLLNASLAMDLHARGLHVYPFVYYLVGAPYNTYDATSKSGKPTVIRSNVMFSSAYMVENLGVTYDVARGWTAGFKVNNIGNNRKNSTTPYPCNGDGLGYYAFSGPASGIRCTPGRRGFLNNTNNPAQTEFFLTHHF